MELNHDLSATSIVRGFVFSVPQCAPRLSEQVHNVGDERDGMQQILALRVLLPAKSADKPTGLDSTRERQTMLDNLRRLGN